MTASNPNTAYSHRPPAQIGHIIREGYDAVARFYDDAYKSIVDQAHDAFLLELMRSVGIEPRTSPTGPYQSGEQAPMQSPNVVDLGCGTGWFIDAVHDTWWPRNYVGMDFSPGMLYRAAAKHPPDPTPRAKLYWLDLDLNDPRDRALAIEAIQGMPLNAAGEWIISLFESPNYLMDLPELLGDMTIRYTADRLRLSTPRRAFLQYSTASRARAESLTKKMGLQPPPITYGELRRLWPSAQIVSFGSLWADHQIDSGHGTGCMKLESWLLRWMPGSVRDRAYWHVVIL